jgi:hypothetical protein
MIKKFKIFENRFSEIDPFDEENWDEIDPVIKNGDIVLCINGINGRSLIKTGQKYSVINVDDFDDLIEVRTIQGLYVGKFFKTRFVKVNNINENHSEIDPFGEENLEDRPNTIRILPNFITYIQPNGIWNKIYLDYIGKIYNVKRERIYNNINCYVIDTGDIIPVVCTEKAN